MKKDVIEELFEKYYNDALLYLISLSRDRETAEEIIAEAFFKALKTADGHIVSFKPWLLKSCRNAYYSLCRERKKYVEPDEKMSDGRESAIDKIIRDERYKALYRAIDLLSPPHKEVILLFYFEEQKISQIAEITGKTSENVKVTLFRARENLKRILEPQNGF